jgi:hypothetical protein
VQEAFLTVSGSNFSPVGLESREALYRRTAEISPPGRSSRCGGVLIGRP